MQCNQLYINERHQSLKCSLKRVDTSTLSITNIYFWIPFVSKINPNHNICPLLCRLFPLVIILICIISITFRNCINNYHIYPLTKHVISEDTHDLFRARQLEQIDVSTWSNLDYLLAEHLSCRASMKWNGQHLRTQGVMHLPNCL